MQYFSVLTITILFMGFADAAVAKAPTKAGEPLSALITNGDKGFEIQLEVRQMPLAQVLDSISEKTHVPIHYSALPEGLVTATCVGTALKPVLECLLNRRADLIVRAPSNPATADNKGQIAEAWILGSKLDGKTACVASAGNPTKPSLSLEQKQQDAQAEQTVELLNMAKSDNSDDRAEAIGALLSVGRKGDPDVKKALEQALTDQDANVRAQAISSLAHREGKDATPAIQEALYDNSVDVRMRAVDGITDNIGLLKQAMNDSDKTIRDFATAKLELLTTQ
jgi:hypothetical protein